MIRARSSMALLVGLLTAVSFAGTSYAHHNGTSNGAPPYSISRYMSSQDPVVSYDLGCNHGRHDLNTPGKQDTVVFLFYGRPTMQRGANGQPIYGTLNYNLNIATFDQIRESVVAYARGYYKCTGADYDSQLQIAVSTSNYDPGPDSLTRLQTADQWFQHGKEFAQLVNQVNSQIRQLKLSSQVSAVGASDMEIDWNTPLNTRKWAEGHNNNLVGTFYYNFGDAGGCPQYTSKIAPGDCLNDWTQADVYYISWELPKANVIPQWYTNGEAMTRQWYRISKWGAMTGRGQIIFSGAMTQWYSCDPSDPDDCAGTDNKFSEAYAQGKALLQSDPQTSRGIGSRFRLTDITWNNNPKLNP